MLFNSYFFIFVFLPIVLAGFYALLKYDYQNAAITWLVLLCLVFYGWWNPVYLGLIVFSIIFNFSTGTTLLKNKKKQYLVFGITINLFLLGYFKYANFFVENINYLSGSDYNLEKIILPLAISFFTFQQITFLVDAYRGKVKEHSFLHYCLFVTFFPQLIAGPIVHHSELFPQFKKTDIYKLRSKNLSIGFTIFIIGLFKKVVLADGIAVPGNAVFSAAEAGITLTFFEAWVGALSYSFQLYFDFSGYSDMAIGLARMFGIILPANFFSLYKAKSIIEFWRRWHITLSRFLRDYLYIPLGGNRKGNVRRYINLFLTMLLGGLWHGAAWTFVLWGGLHGVFLVINHVWSKFRSKIVLKNKTVILTGGILGRFVTFLLVVSAWVVFRAETFDGAVIIYQGMLAVNGIPLPDYVADKLLVFGSIPALLGINYDGMFHNFVISDDIYVLKILMLMLGIVWFLPNTLQFIGETKPALGIEDYSKETRKIFIWKPNIYYLFILAVVGAVSIMYVQQESQFLYFQF